MPEQLEQRNLFILKKHNIMILALNNCPEGKDRIYSVWIVGR